MAAQTPARKRKQSRGPSTAAAPSNRYVLFGVGAVLVLIVALYLSDGEGNKVDRTKRTASKHSTDHDAVRSDPNANLHMQAGPHDNQEHASSSWHSCPAIVKARAASQLKLDSPAEYLAQTAAAMQQVGELKECQPEDVMELHSLLADAYGHMKDFEQAVTHRKASLQYMKRLGKASSKDYITQLVALATDLYLNFEFTLALARLQDARAVVPSKRLPPAAERLLLLLEATIHECNGDVVTSLQRLETAFRMTQESPSLNEVQRHVDLLKRVLQTQKEYMPKHVVEAMEKKIQGATRLLITHGPWNRADQLPKHFQPGLFAAPWHHLEDHAHVAQAVAVLRQYSAALREEYHQLAASDKLMREHECIHDMNGGKWTRYESTAYWRPLNKETGCSRDTPTACLVTQALRDVGLPVFRAGYSSLEAHAWLKPHFGMTNGQLKLHLGLIVPQTPEGAPCATFRVGNVTEAWQQDRVLFFDDSFEHEVHNDCPKTRVVFQVVFAHPDLPSTTEVTDLFPKSQAGQNH
eukprot:m.72475 g.72475  ORF g.72475 m.72475 type:complete len:523 (+) comp14265_c0_seq1:35-1603(+)